MEDNRKKWTPEIEARYQHVQRYYDRARGLGLDLLKLVLNTTIVFAGVPFIFFEKLEFIFGQERLLWIYAAWILILLSLIFAFLAYLFFCEGYYHQGHHEWNRWLGNDAQHTLKVGKKFNSFFDFAHWLAIGLALSFLFAIFCIIIAIGLRLKILFF